MQDYSEAENYLLKLLTNRRLAYLKSPLRAFFAHMNGNTYRKIQKTLELKKNTQEECEKLLRMYFWQKGIECPPKKEIKHIKEDPEKIRERVARHRAKFKDLGYKTITFQINEKKYKTLKKYCESKNVSFSEALEVAICSLSS
jgi:hypothetical protein